MHSISIVIALLVGCAIIAIGARYLVNPRAMAPSFGLPLPEEGRDTTAWLRLKGVRDVSSGLLLLVLTALGGYRAVGLVLLVLALIPLGDMTIILAAKGRVGTALGVHGLTAIVMLLGAIPPLMATR